MADVQSLDAVFGELIHQRTGQYVVEEAIELRDQAGLRILLPAGTPEEGEHPHRGQQRAAAVSEVGVLRGRFERSPQRPDLNRVRSHMSHLLDQGRVGASFTLRRAAGRGMSPTAAPRTHIALMARKA